MSILKLYAVDFPPNSQSDRNEKNRGMKRSRATPWGNVNGWEEQKNLRPFMNACTRNRESCGLHHFDQSELGRWNIGHALFYRGMSEHLGIHWVRRLNIPSISAQSAVYAFSFLMLADYVERQSPSVVVIAFIVRMTLQGGICRTPHCGWNCWARRIGSKVSAPCPWEKPSASTHSENYNTLASDLYEHQGVRTTSAQLSDRAVLLLLRILVESSALTLL